jgi:hypothetical protein
MSMNQHEGALYQGIKAMFPIAVRQLHRSMELNEIYNLERIKAVAKKIGGFVEATPRVQTSDGYTWFCALHFKQNNDDMYVLIPMETDTDKKHGTRSDRSIAIYVNTDIFSGVEAMAICELLNEACYPDSIV